MVEKEVARAMQYDGERVERALTVNRIPERNGESLDDYLSRTGNSDQFYAHLTEEDGSNLPADVMERKYLGPEEKGPMDIWERNARAIASTEENSEEWYDQFMGILADFKFVPGGRLMHGAGRDDARRSPTLSNCYVVPLSGVVDRDTYDHLEEVLGYDEQKANEVREVVDHSSKENDSYDKLVEGLQRIGLSNDAISTIASPPDSTEAVYQIIKEMGQIYRSGGGVGTDLSPLRPKGSSVNATVDQSPGVMAFMNLLSENTNAISQAGRRGALMLTLGIDHPDAEDFATIKNDPNRTDVQHANISLRLTDKFMQAVISGDKYAQRWVNPDKASPRYGIVEVEKEIDARDLWNKIIETAHSSAEPGLMFWDRMTESHNVEYANPLVSTNPCGEQPLAAYTACNLGNLNLLKFVRDNGTLDLEDLVETTGIATRFLDDIIDVNDKNHASRKIAKSVRSDRRVGLGITGLADALVKMGIKYDSKEGLAKVEEIMQAITYTAYETSIDLAGEKGKFPLFDADEISQSKFIQSLPEELQEKIKEKGLRNSTLITMPPVGSGSIVAETSSGIEPIFCTHYTRRVKQEDGTSFKEYAVFHPLIKEMIEDGDLKEEDVMSGENLPSHIVTAHDIDPKSRVKMQGVLQKYTDSSISSTINLSEDTTVETVSDIYITAFEEGLKGVTVFREGSREGILQTEEQTDKKSKPNLEEKVISDPIKLPGIMPSVRLRQPTHVGNIHMQVVVDPREDYIPREVFAQLGNAGTEEAAVMEALGRSASLHLRRGLPIGEIIAQYKDIGSGAGIATRDGGINSLPQGFANALTKFEIGREMYGIEEILLGHVNLEEIDGEISDYMRTGEDIFEKDRLPEEHEGKNYENEEDPSEEEKKNNSPFSRSCPECGEGISHEGGCVDCKHCGWSKC